ncbi:MAG: class I SAM-dependent methyltransferase [Chloroflexota bacterium]
MSKDELSAYYPDNYDPYQRGVVDELSAIQKLSRDHEMSRRSERIDRYFDQPGKVLDIGCATGLFLGAMQQNGWECTGIEPSQYASEYARSQYGLEVVTGTLEDTQMPSNSFDVVTMWDVLEHVDDPMETLNEVNRLLKPNGLLVVSLPNPNSVEASIFGDSWIGWDRPRHLNIFSTEVIKKYLDKTGYQFEKVESFGGRLALTLMSMDFWIVSKNYNIQRWQKIRTFIYNPVFRVLTWPIYRVLGALNRLTIMTVFAFKK